MPDKKVYSVDEVLGFLRQGVEIGYESYYFDDQDTGSWYSVGGKDCDIDQAWGELVESGICEEVTHHVSPVSEMKVLVLIEGRETMLYNDKSYRIEARRGESVVKLKWVSAGSAEEACRLLKQDMVSSGWFSDAEELTYIHTGEVQ